MRITATVSITVDEVVWAKASELIASPNWRQEVRKEVKAWAADQLNDHLVEGVNSVTLKY